MGSKIIGELLLFINYNYFLKSISSNMYLTHFGRHLDTSLSTPLHRKQKEESSYFKDRYGCPLINPESILKQHYFSNKDNAGMMMTEEDKEGGSRIKTSIDGTSGPLTYGYLLNCEEDGQSFFGNHVTSILEANDLRDQIKKVAVCMKKSSPEMDGTYKKLEP
jgi:hypothetical protein